MHSALLLLYITTGITVRLSTFHHCCAVSKAALAYRSWKVAALPVVSLALTHWKTSPSPLRHRYSYQFQRLTLPWKVIPQQEQRPVASMQQPQLTVPWNANRRNYHTNQLLGARGSSCEPPECDNGQRRDSVVCVEIPWNDKKITRTLIDVKDNDFIDTIKERIKIMCSPEFDSTPTFRINLFESADDKEPLGALERWNPDVTWGTEAAPLIVKLNRFAVSLSSSSKYPEKIKRAQELIHSIMKDYEDIPNSEGMKVLRNVLNLETGRSINVVIRNITEDYWKQVIENTKEFRVCAMGTPSIGKTPATVVLIRLLLQQKKSVVYRVRKNENLGLVHVFTPTLEATIDVNVIPERDFDPYDENINQPSTYYVVDPGQTTDNCNLPDDFEGKVIIVASPNEGHWGDSDFFKGRGDKNGGMLLLMPVWTLPELIQSSSIFDTRNGETLGLSEQEIKDRFYRFGGVPMYVFASRYYYEYQLGWQDQALARLSKADAMYLSNTKCRCAIQKKSSKLQWDSYLSYNIRASASGESVMDYRFGRKMAEFRSGYVGEYIKKRRRRTMAYDIV